MSPESVKNLPDDLGIRNDLVPDVHDAGNAARQSAGQILVRLVRHIA